MQRCLCTAAATARGGTCLPCCQPGTRENIPSISYLPSYSTLLAETMNTPPVHAPHDPLPSALSPATCSPNFTQLQISLCGAVHLVVTGNVKVQQHCRTSSHVTAVAAQQVLLDVPMRMHSSDTCSRRHSWAQSALSRAPLSAEPGPGAATPAAGRTHPTPSPLVLPPHFALQDDSASCSWLPGVSPPAMAVTSPDAADLSSMRCDHVRLRICPQPQPRSDARTCTCVQLCGLCVNVPHSAACQKVS